MIAVMRYPVLMEDEGRHSFVKSFPTKELALDWIQHQENEYFKPQDYYILTEEKP